jgi:predicted nucleic acid-binding protein
MILVDASVFYARIAEDDEHHLEADAFFRTREPRLTTTAVVYETHALMLRISRVPASAHAARRFLEEIDAGLARVIHVTTDDHRRAVALVGRHQDKSYSLCDAVSFVVMDRLRIKRAASFDRHFRQYGKFVIWP